MAAARGPEWTDLLGDLLPIVITVIIGILALTRRVVEAIFKRRAEEARAKPRPPLNEEVRQFLEMLDKDTGRSTAAPAPAPGEVDETPPTELPIDFPAVPAAPDTRAVETAAPPSIAPAMTVAPALERAGSRHERERRHGAGIDLRQAMVWSEILARPLSERAPRET